MPWRARRKLLQAQYVAISLGAGRASTWLFRVSVCENMAFKWWRVAASGGVVLTGQQLFLPPENSGKGGEFGGCSN
jgi:hypothetical protein